MNNEMNDKLFLTGRAHYSEAFWKAMRGNDAAYTDLAGAKHNLTNTYLLPESTASKYSAALKEHNLFRRIGTVMNATKNDSTIWISDNEFQPEWVPEYGTIPTTADSHFPKKDMVAHKLAIITALETVGQFSKRFCRAEENAFVNGNGAEQPHGVLTDAETGVMVSGNIGFDDVLALYFSVDKQYRSGGAWLMNDETALKLKTLKDQNGQYLWNQNSDTVLGKPVHISEFMPTDGKPIAFGDFSYYTIIDRIPLSVRTLYEKFALEQKTGYLGVEHLDGMLIRPEAVKVLTITA